MIKKKQATTQQEWLDFLNNVPAIISRRDVDHRVDRTVEEVKRYCKGKRVAHGWSGGKDSLALTFVMEQAGIYECVLARSNLEYPAFIEWVEKNRPEALTVFNSGLDLNWLSRNEHMLFPQDSKIAAKWFKIIQHRGQDWYFKEKGLDFLALGRRKGDGNYTGPKGEIQYTNKKGVTRYCPIAHWTHEEVLGLIYYYDIDLPPCYYWPRGFRVGTGAWPARQWTESWDHGFQEVFEIDPDLVREAGESFRPARDFLKRHGL